MKRNLLLELILFISSNILLLINCFWTVPTNANLLTKIVTQKIKTSEEMPKTVPLLLVFCPKIYAIIGSAAKIVSK